MTIEDEVEKYTKMFEGINLIHIGITDQTKWNQMIYGLLIEMRDKLDELLGK